MGSKTLSAVALAALLGAAAPVDGAGFSIYEQGARAMGMAGAFTAQADDGSAMFHNVGGLAFQRERSFQLGGTFIRNIDSEFRGAPPFPGEGATGELSSLDAIVPNFYWVEPLGEAWTFGLHVDAPFGLETEWENPDEWAGRFISTKASLRVLDVGPNLGFKLTESFGAGLGAFARMSDVELQQRSAAFNPFIQQFSEVARVHLESDLEQGYGWQVGILHQAHPSFSWGGMYRSKVEVDYGGAARLTQIPTGDPLFDGLIATILPFDQNVPVKTSIEFPDQASVGVALRLSDSALVEVDANWTGWSSFDTLVIDFTDGSLPDSVLLQDYEDVWHYRVGLRFATGGASEWRFGYVYDETPQPEASAGPLLPDETRNGFTVGYGRAGDGLDWDLALMYLPFDDRVVDDESRDGFFGTYETTALLLGGSLSW